MNGGVGPGPGMMHMGGNVQQPMYPFGPTDHMEQPQQPHGPKVDQHNNSWDSHLNMEDKHNMVSCHATVWNLIPGFWLYFVVWIQFRVCKSWFWIILLSNLRFCRLIPKWPWNRSNSVVYCQNVVGMIQILTTILIFSKKLLKFSSKFFRFSSVFTKVNNFSFSFA
jgi:hypothetical protein